MSTKEVTPLLRAREERTDLEFKSDVDPDSKEFWCNLCKHLVSLANTAGGYLIVGVNDDYEPVGVSKSKLARLDISTVINCVSKYLYEDLDSIRFKKIKNKGLHFGIFYVDKHEIPLVFAKDGQYRDSGGNTRNVFSKGDIYFRHGGKSERANQRDLNRVLKEYQKRLRKEWSKGVRKAINLPPNQKLVSVPKEVMVDSERREAVPVRLSDELDAMPVRVHLDTEKYESLGEELKGAIKLWKSDSSNLLSLRTLCSFYIKRDTIALTQPLCTESAEVGWGWD